MVEFPNKESGISSSHFALIRDITGYIHDWYSEVSSLSQASHKHTDALWRLDVTSLIAAGSNIGQQTGSYLRNLPPNRNLPSIDVFKNRRDLKFNLRCGGFARIYDSEMHPRSLGVRGTLPIKRNTPYSQPWTMRGAKFIRTKHNLLFDETRLAPRNYGQRDCEKGYKNGGHCCNSAIVGIEPIKPARELTHGELVLLWVLMPSPFLAGIPAEWLVSDIYRISSFNSQNSGE